MKDAKGANQPWLPWLAHPGAGPGAVILLDRIISYDILALPQLSLIRTDNYHGWWEAHIYLSIQTEMVLHPFEPLTNGCPKSGQHEPCLLFIWWQMWNRTDLPSYQEIAVPKHLAILYPPVSCLWLSHHPNLLCLCSPSPHSLLPFLPGAAMNRVIQLPKEPEGAPKGTLFRGLPNSFEGNSHFWKQAKHLIQMSLLVSSRNYLVLTFKALKFN